MAFQKLSKGVLHSRIDRRKALRTAMWTTLGGSIAFNELGLGPSVQSLFHKLMLSTAGRSVDSRQLLVEALKGGPALFRWDAARALADETGQPWSVVHIKVVNHVATNLVFRLGEMQEDGISTVNASDRNDTSLLEQDGTDFRPIIFDKFTSENCRKMIAEAGVGKLSDLPLGLSGEDDTTYGKKFRMNGWFARMLHNPLAEGAVPQEYIDRGFVSSAVNKALDHQKVGLQCALGLDQAGMGNHALRNFKLRRELPDFSYYVEEQGLVTSPLGISAFMMGERYDSANEGSMINMVVKSRSDAEESAVDGAPVRTYANTIVQTIESANARESSYSDPRKEDSLTLKFDKLVTSDPALRKQMYSAQEQLEALVSELVDTARFEDQSIFDNTPGTDSPWRDVGCVQIDESGTPTPARGEFLSQVRFACKMLQIPGRPVQNFSLFLNMQDLDQENLDFSTKVDVTGARPLSYVEGMRQLAIGLNSLAKVIEELGNVIVVVVSEGGRLNNMADGSVSFAFSMGPKAAGFETKLFGDEAAYGVADSTQVANPGLGPGQTNGGMHIYSGGQLFNASGSAINAGANIGDFQAGAIRALDELIGKGASLAEIGNFIKLRG